MKLTVWNKALLDAKGSAQAVLYENASWEFGGFPNTGQSFVSIKHSGGHTLIPFDCVAQILEQPEPGDAKAH